MAHPALKVFVIRHAERLDRALEKTAQEKGVPLTVDQFRALFSRPQDPPLSAGGRAMARKVGEALITRGVKVDKIFSSPLSRCVQTSDLIADTIGLPRDHPCIMLEDALCEEACSMRYPRCPILPSRFEQSAISSRIDLDYTSLRPVLHEDMQDRGWQVRNLNLMCPEDSAKKSLDGDPEIHCLRELCTGLPNPFDPSQQQMYSDACVRLGLLQRKGNPGFEVTILRVRELLQRLLPLEEKGNGDAVSPRKKQKHEQAQMTFVLVTHGAITTAVLSVLTGEPLSDTTPVGTFYELHQVEPASFEKSLGRWVHVTS